MLTFSLLSLPEISSTQFRWSDFSPSPYIGKCRCKNSNERDYPNSPAPLRRYRLSSAQMASQRSQCNCHRNPHRSQCRQYATDKAHPQRPPDTDADDG